MQKVKHFIAPLGCVLLVILSSAGQSQIVKKNEYINTNLDRLGWLFTNCGHAAGVSAFSLDQNISIGNYSATGNYHYMVITDSGHVSFGFEYLEPSQSFKHFQSKANELLASGYGTDAFDSTFSEEVSNLSSLNMNGNVNWTRSIISPNGIGAKKSPKFMTSSSQRYFFQTSDSNQIVMGNCTTEVQAYSQQSILEYDTNLNRICSYYACDDYYGEFCAVWKMDINEKSEKLVIGTYQGTAIEIFGTSTVIDSANSLKNYYAAKLDSNWNLVYLAELDHVEQLLDFGIDNRGRAFLTVVSGNDGVSNSDASKFSINGTVYNEDYGAGASDERLIAFRLEANGDLGWISINESYKSDIWSGEHHAFYDKQFTSYMYSPNVSKVVDGTHAGEIVFWAIDSSGNRTAVENWDTNPTNSDYEFAVVGMDSSVMIVSVSSDPINLPGGGSISGSDSTKKTLGIMSWQPFSKAKPFSVKEVDSPNQLSVFPNPGSTGFQLSAVPDSDVRLYNNQGRLMATWKHAQDKTYPVQDVPSGIYFIQTILDERPVSIKWVCLSE